MISHRMSWWNGHLARRMFAHAVLVPAFTVAAILILPSCAHTTDRFSIARPAASASAFDIENTLGGVEVRVDPMADRVSIHIAGDDDDARVFAETQAAANGRSVTRIVVEPTERSAASIDNEEDPASIRNISGKDVQPVDLIVVTPVCDGLRIRAAGGTIISGVNSSIDALTHEGDLTVIPGGPIHTSIQLVAKRGCVRLELPPGSTGKLDLFAPAGQTRLEAKRVALTKVVSTLNETHATLSGGENAIVLRAERGDAVLMVY